MDDVMFPYNGLYGDVTLPQQRRCVMLFTGAPTLLGLVVYRPRRVFRAGVAGRSMLCTIALFKYK